VWPSFLILIVYKIFRIIKVILADINIAIGTYMIDNIILSVVLKDVARYKFCKSTDLQSAVINVRSKIENRMKIIRKIRIVNIFFI